MKSKFEIGQQVWLIGDGQPTKQMIIGIRLEIKEYHRIDRAKFKYLTTCYGKEYEEKEIFASRDGLFKYLNERADWQEDEFRVKYIYGNKNGRTTKIAELLAREDEQQPDGDTGEIE